MSRVLVVLVSAAAGLIVVYALMSAIDERSAPAIVIESPPTPATLAVAISGAVATPGLYTLPANARLADAVSAAGGLAPNADLADVNLARRVSDGDAIAIPAIAVTSTRAASRAGDEAPKPPEQAAAAAVLDLNAASAEELDALPGIGPVLAQRIVDDRTQNGPFATVDDLARVQGISARMVDALRANVVAR